MVQKQISEFPSPRIWNYWGENQVLLYAREGGWWDASNIGTCPQPIYTPDGWLIYDHGVCQTTPKISYWLGLTLLDFEDPRKVLHRSEGWIFGPHEMYKRGGDFSDAVFPCGWVLVNDEVRIYYEVPILLYPWPAQKWVIFLSIFMGVLRSSVLKNTVEGLKETGESLLIQKEDNLKTVLKA